MSQMVNCKACGKEIAKGVKKCPHCGKDQRNFFMKHKIITGIIVIAIIGGIGSALGNKNKDTSTNSKTTANNTTETSSKDNSKTTSTAPVQKPKDDSKGDGMYKVGSDIQPGEYVIVGSDAGSYVEVTKDSTGSVDSIVMNDNIQGRVYVTIANGQYLTIKNAKAYPAAKAPKVTATDNKLPDGEYKVGVDIQAGEYKVSSAANGYVEVDKDSLHSIDGIVSNDNFSGDKYVTIASGQYIIIKNGDILLK